MKGCLIFQLSQINEDIPPTSQLIPPLDLAFYSVPFNCDFKCIPTAEAFCNSHHANYTWYNFSLQSTSRVVSHNGKHKDVLITCHN